MIFKIRTRAATEFWGISTYCTVIRNQCPQKLLNKQYPKLAYVWPFCSTACKLTLDPGLTECSKTIKVNKFYIIESMSLKKSVTAKYYNSPLRIQNSLRLRRLPTFFKWQLLLRIGWMLWTLLSNNPPSALPSTLALKVKRPYLRI